MARLRRFCHARGLLLCGRSLYCSRHRAMEASGSLPIVNPWPFLSDDKDESCEFVWVNRRGDRRRIWPLEAPPQLYQTSSPALSKLARYCNGIVRRRQSGARDVVSDRCTDLRMDRPVNERRARRLSFTTNSNRSLIPRGSFRKPSARELRQTTTGRLRRKKFVHTRKAFLHCWES
jgi:hypothetical protein